LLEFQSIYQLSDMLIHLSGFLYPKRADVIGYIVRRSGHIEELSAAHELEQMLKTHVGIVILVDDSHISNPLPQKER
jgi:hypothetical protein